MSKIKSTTQNDMMSGFIVFAEEESLLMGHDVAADGWEGVETVETREKIPGSESYVDDGSSDVAEVKEVKPQTPKTWEKHKAVSDFMRYLKESYPAKIPPHDGTTISGAEAAVVWLGNLLKEISRAIRKDTAGVLDTVVIEEFRVRIMKDIILLNNHIKKLHERFKTKHAKLAGLDDGIMKFAEEIELLYNSEESDSLKKTAMIPRIQLVVQPFERAIAGIIVNSVISGGKPLEEVYDFLKDKYKLTDREELAIMQVVMDYGYPIFKDRGTIGDKADKDSGKKHGIEFIKNYFS